MKKLLAITCVLIVSGSNVYAQNKPLYSKTEILKIYDSLFISSSIDSIAWNGNTKKCDCGTLAPSVYEKAQDRINFFRIVNGLNEVTVNPDFNTDAQNAALLIKANGKLTHTPSKSMKCYSESAYTGCNSSCLGTTNWRISPKSSFIIGFIEDYGASNYYIGHRKWLLYTKLRTFGYGATNTTEAVLTTKGTNYNDTISAPEFVAYPWHGYVPKNLIYPRWSFSIPESEQVDFSNAAISISDNTGKKYPSQTLKLYKNYLDHTIVWEPTGINTEEGKRFTIKINNVMVNGEVKNYSYFVEPISTEEIEE